MNDQPTDRDLGPQPIAARLADRQLTPHDLVAASTEQLTHKQVTKACKGRWLTPNLRAKVLRAYNTAAHDHATLADLFNY